MAAAKAREATPPPIIGKAGRYTVFLTPPATPKPSETPKSQSPNPKFSHRNLASLSSIPNSSPKSVAPLSSIPNSSPRSVAPLPAKVAASPSLPPPPPPPPPVQVPPKQFDKPGLRNSSSGFGFFWDAVAKVQDAHSSLDEYLADWFGLNQSKYQWALNDYYENNGMDKEGGKPKELSSKGQVV